MAEVVRPVTPILDEVLPPLTPVVRPVLGGLPDTDASESGSGSGGPSASPHSGPPPSGLKGAPATGTESPSSFAPPPVAVPPAAYAERSLGSPEPLDRLVPIHGPQSATHGLAGLPSDWAAALQLSITGTVFGPGPLSAVAEAAPDVAHAGSGGSSSNSAPAPASGGAAGSGAAGVASSALFALLISFTAFALWHLARLLLTPARWRSQAFVAVLERPG